MAEGILHVAVALVMDIEIAMFAKELVEYISWESIFLAPHVMVD